MSRGSCGRPDSGRFRLRVARQQVHQQACPERQHVEAEQRRIARPRRTGHRGGGDDATGGKLHRADPADREEIHQRHAPSGQVCRHEGARMRHQQPVGTAAQADNDEEHCRADDARNRDEREIDKRQQAHRVAAYRDPFAGSEDGVERSIEERPGNHRQRHEERHLADDDGVRAIDVGEIGAGPEPADAGSRRVVEHGQRDDRPQHAQPQEFAIAGKAARRPAASSGLGRIAHQKRDGERRQEREHAERRHHRAPAESLRRAGERRRADDVAGRAEGDHPGGQHGKAGRRIAPGEDEQRAPSARARSRSRSAPSRQ